MKKVLKKIGKTVGCIFTGVFIFLALCCVVTLCWSAVQMSKGSITDSLPSVPDDFKPSVRFVVYTDTHNENENVDDLFETVYKLYDNDKDYKGVDAVIGLGDFTSIGTEPDYEAYVETIKKYERKETKIINILGNHEMKNKSATELFKKYFGYEPNTVTEINGFTFLCFSGSEHITEWTFPVKDLKWAADELEKAESKANGKPIFVFQHPHNFGTVYGSTIWCSPQTNAIWAGHSNVVNFSGHSHFPADDPRSINQTTYTSVGVGAMARFELDNRYIVGQHPDGYDMAAEFCCVEADNDGSVRIREYDLNSDTYFNEYFIENVNDKSTFAYTYKNLKAHDSTPVFDEKTLLKTHINDNGEWVISFNEATDNYIVHDYIIKITDENGKKVLNKTYVDDYYVIDGDDTADFRIPAETLEEGKTYTAYITAVNAYHMKSEVITLEFIAEK